MNLPTAYIADLNFVQEYLSTSRGRRRTTLTLLAFAATLALILVAEVCLGLI